MQGSHEANQLLGDHVASVEVEGGALRRRGGGRGFWKTQTDCQCILAPVPFSPGLTYSGALL